MKPHTALISPLEWIPPMRFWICAFCVLVISPAAQALDATLAPLSQLPERAACEHLPGGLPDGCAVKGQRDIAQAWLSGPTARYTHGVLGDAIEATSLRVETRDGHALSYFLPEDSVFEDIVPRLYDVNGDGRDEIITIKSTINDGAALVLLGVREGELVLLAETDPIGAAKRWLNPVGAGDFDGDGRVEIAYVQTPHIGGILKVVHWQGDRLAQVAERYGYSNHAIGSRELGMAAVMDANGDGIVDLIVPGVRRDTLHVVTLNGARLKEAAKIELDAPLQSGLTPTAEGLAFQLQNGWGGGKIFELRFK